VAAVHRGDGAVVAGQVVLGEQVHDQRLARLVTQPRLLDRPGLAVERAVVVAALAPGHVLVREPLLGHRQVPVQLLLHDRFEVVEEVGLELVFGGHGHAVPSLDDRYSRTVPPRTRHGEGGHRAVPNLRKRRFRWSRVGARRVKSARRQSARGEFCRSGHEGVTPVTCRGAGQRLSAACCHIRFTAARSSGLGTSFRAGNAALYCTPGTHSARPAATASSPARATSSRRSHSRLGGTSSSVRVKPGQSAVTWTPLAATSECRLSENAATYALVAPYVALPGDGANPAIDATFSTPPRPRSIMPGSAAWVSRTSAFTFSSICAR